MSNSIDTLLTDITTAGVPISAQDALVALDKALSAGIEITKIRQAEKSERAFIQAQKEVQIITIENQTKKAMGKDKITHEQRMVLLKTIQSLLVENAQALTPEIMSACQLVREMLKEVQ